MRDDDRLVRETYGRAEMEEGRIVVGVFLSSQRCDCELMLSVLSGE
ncbi:MAG: hypothetical protein ACUVRS_12030 [Armatimonadota bacterium]